jgi:hypothetical protein
MFSLPCSECKERIVFLTLDIFGTGCQTKHLYKQRRLIVLNYGMKQSLKQEHRREEGGCRPVTVQYAVLLCPRLSWRATEGSPFVCG